MKLLTYIHRNPIRAYIVKNPSSYRWSSHNAYLGAEDFLWITTNYGLAKFDNSLENARKIYNSHVQKKELEEDLSILRSQFVDGQLLGDDNFVDDIRERFDKNKIIKIPFSEVISLACTHFDIDKASISSSAQSRNVSIVRGAITMIARDCPEFTLEQAAPLLRRKSNTLSGIAKRFEKKIQTDSEMQDAFCKLKAKIEQACLNSQLGDLEA